MKVFVILMLLSIVSFAYSDDGCPTIKTRRRWGGDQPRSIDYQILPVKYVIINHTVSQKCSTFAKCAEIVKGIQDFHMKNLGWDDIGYNFLIGNDGNVYEGVGWHKVGAHTYGYNRKALGIAFIGNFSDELPSASALQAAKQLLSCGVKKGELDRRYKLLGARQVVATASPGTELYYEIQDWDNWQSSP